MPMALRACLLAAGLSQHADALNLVNRESGLCLDLFAPCVDGSHAQGCQRQSLESLTKGTNLQLFTCTGGINQDFELLSDGRIRNPLTGLCMDILAPCKDHFRTPCERAPVDELKHKANIQLFTCHQDDSGVLSNSYGNQVWNFDHGQLRNTPSNLCLEPKVDASGKMTDMTDIRAETCKEAAYQKFDFLKFDATSGSVAMEPPSSQHTLTKYQVLRGQLPEPRDLRARVLVGLVAVGLLALAVAFAAAGNRAVFATVRPRHTPLIEE